MDQPVRNAFLINKRRDRVNERAERKLYPA